MNKKEIVEKIGEVLKTSQDFEKVIAEIKELKILFVELVKVQHDELRKSHDEASSTEPFKPPHDEWDGKFSEQMTAFNQKKKKWDEQKAHELIRNFETKKKITSDLKKLIEEEHHIGPAFVKFNELKDKWKETGPVPNAEYKELQREYSHLIEEFFYNINIYKTLKAYDLQKNLKLKLDLIEKVRALIPNNSVKDVRDLISLYIQEWDEVGPTHQNQWEKIRDEFWEIVRQVHKKMADHYKEQKEKIKHHLEEKQKLCERIEELKSKDFSDFKHWNRYQKEVHAIQEEWKKLGFAGKKTNDEVWNRFRKAIREFYDHGKSRMDEMKEVFREHEDIKVQLIERAEQLRDSVEWKETALEFKKLQADWKKAGSSHPAKEQKLWRKFRAASEQFFNRRKEYFDGREEREKKNLEKKQELLSKLKSIDKKTEGDLLKILQDMAREWNAIGYIPRLEKQKIESDFTNLLNAKMKSLGMDSSEIESRVFELKLEGIRGSENSAELLRNEYHHLGDKLHRIMADIKQYENNLGFFGRNTNNPLVKEVVQKIENSRMEAGRIKARMQLLEK